MLFLQALLADLPKFCERFRPLYKNIKITILPHMETRTKNITKTDIAVIGAGPVGLFMVFEAGFLGYKCAVIDSLPHIGGQLAALYPEKPIYDIPGYPSVLAGDIVEKLAEQGAPFDPQYILGNPVSELTEKKDGSFIVGTATDEVHCKVVIIAAGMGVFTPRRPPLENLASFENTSVFYSVQKKAQFADKEIVIAGGGDSAVDWAVELAANAKHIHVIHRRNAFRAAEETVRQMRELEAAGKVTIHAPAQLSELKGENGQLETVTIADLDGNKTGLSADTLLCFFGMSPALGPIHDWNIDLAGKKIAVEASTMETTRKGVLAIGDITDYPGKLDLILTGFAEGAIAAKTAQGIIDPEKKFKLVYTTSKGVPAA